MGYSRKSDAWSSDNVTHSFYLGSNIIRNKNQDQKRETEKTNVDDRSETMMGHLCDILKSLQRGKLC